MQPITIDNIAQWLRIKQWDDDPEFVDDLLYFIPLMDDVWRDIKQKEIEKEKARRAAEAKRDRKLTRKGVGNGNA